MNRKLAFAPLILLASLSGWAARADGPLAKAGEACGGIAGLKCDAGLYCATPIGTCGVADQQGKCASKPQVCPKTYLPVCGCDNKTHGNACEAAASGVNVAHKGKCTKGS
jgi:hypothetical protein